MSEWITFGVFALAAASIYAVAASGLVLTYTTSGIFNWAHGAIAMFSAFVYWQLSSPKAWDLPTPVALVLTLGVFAPGLGWLLDRLLMRRIHDAPPIVRLVVPIGVMVALIQLASILWPPRTVNASLPDFFAGKTVSIGDAVVTYHQLIIFATALAVALGLRLLLYRTRLGVAMRGVVDNRELAALNGADPNRVSALAWALGCSLAAVAGILVASLLKLDQIQLTFLVMNAYAAALVGRLRSLPLTALGALVLGLAREGARKFQADLPSWITVDTVPSLMLFLVLLLVPQDKAIVFGGRKDRARIPTTTVRTAALAGLVLMVLAFLAPGQMGGETLRYTGYALALSIVALSLVPLTGYAGQISLAPLAFAGIGALVMHRFGADGNPLGLVAAALVCAVVGVLVALPALRLRGLHLALATMAFAVFCEKAVFTNAKAFYQSSPFERLQLGPIDTSSPRANLLLMATVFALIGVGLTALRRGPFGRRLQALKDSPAACATIGLNPTAAKLQVFALSAAIAGVGGALYAGWRGQATVDQFSLLGVEPSALPMALLVVIFGIAAVAGALLAALMLSLVPLLAADTEWLKNLLNLLPGLASFGLARKPEGAIAQTGDELRRAWRTIRKTEELDDEPVSAVRKLLAPDPPTVVPETVGGGRPLAPDDLAVLDDELGLSWGRCRVAAGDA